MYISDVLREEFKLDLISTAILQHFAFWINKNASDGKNVNNEKCWTFQTLNQIAKYLKITVARVRYAIDKLVAKGYLIKDNFNKTAYDRTIWYSFKDEQILQKIISEINKKNPPINSQMEKIKLSNPSEEISEPIPKAKNKISTKEALNESQSKPKITFETISQEKKEISATLVSFKLSKMQTNRIIKEFDIPYIQSKIKQFEYISKNYPKKFKKYPKASYLYNSIYDNWEDEDYLKYLAIKQKEQLKEQKDKENRELLKKQEIIQKQKNEYEKYITIEAKKEYQTLTEQEKRQIDDTIKKQIGLNAFVMQNNAIFNRIIETRRVEFVLERIKNKIISFDEFLKLLPVQ